MKKILLTLILGVSALASWAYSFSAVAPSGQTLYYNISGSTVSVTCPGSRGSSYSTWYGYFKPTGSLTIPSTVTYNGRTYSVISIGSNAFDYCSDLTSVTIPNSVTSISSKAFYGCSGLTSVTIPNSVTSIYQRAFAYCSSLTSVTIPNSVTSIGPRAFTDCYSLTSITVDPNNSRYNSFNNCNAIIETASNTLICGCQSTTIPNSVTSIGSYAFYGSGGLTTVTIPNSVTSIGSSAFYNCSGLTTVTIPNSVTSIGSDAFCGCSGLTSVTIPNSVTSISSNAFNGCRGLTSVTIPSSVTSIGDWAFCGCSSLTSVTIPNSVTSIGSYAFSNCSRLSIVSVPNFVTSISEAAFSNCISLLSVIIPNTVTSIGHMAFKGCSRLDTIICNAGTPPTVSDSTTFSTVPIYCKVLVPCGSASAYRSAQYWSRFSNLIEDSDFPYTLSAVSADGTRGYVNVTQHPSCANPTAVITATPAHNFHFVNWSDGNTDNPRTITLTQDTSLVAYFQYINPRFTVHYASMDTLYGVVNPIISTRLIIGNSASTSYNSPFNNYYCNSTNECLYLASEISGAGQIDTISYYVASAYSFACSELKIYMGTTTQTNLSSGWVGFDNLQCVYSRASITIGRSTGWESYALDTPFEYNGTDNLIVVVCRQSSSYTSSLKYRYTSASNMCRYRQSDSSPSGYGTLSGTATGSTTSERANIRLSMAAPDHSPVSQREMGSTVELAATPKPGNRFFAWSDRCTDNPRSITITQDTSVIAYFSPEPAVEYVHDTTIVNNYIHDTTFVDNYIHDTTIVHDTVFVTLFLRDSTIIYGSHDTIFVHDTVRDCHEQQLFVLTNNDILGACAGSGSYPLGSTVQIMAIPNRGQRFLCWSDGVTSNPRTVTLTGNLTYTAIFLREDN